MRYLLKINELVKNLDTLKSILREMLKEINGFFKLKNDNIRKDEFRLNIFRLDLIGIPEDADLINKIEVVLNNYKKILFENNLIMSLQKSKETGMDFDDDFNITPNGIFTYHFIMYFKNLYTTEITTNKYVYHYSPSENRESILKNGIIPKESKDSERWSKDIDLEYPPLIFAMNDSPDNQGWHYNPEVDIWQIDTTQIPNKWWEDLNNRYGRTDLVMTADSIPSKYITLFRSLSLKPLN